MSQKRIITDPEAFPIQPNHIDASDHLWDSFDQLETETSARWIILFMQKRGQSWAPFTYDDINSFYSERLRDGFTFNRLINPEMVPPSLARALAGHLDERVPVGGGWIILDADNNYYVTDDFVDRCFKSRPAAQSATAQG